MYLLLKKKKKKISQLKKEDRINLHIKNIKKLKKVRNFTILKLDYLLLRLEK